MTFDQVVETLDGTRATMIKSDLPTCIFAVGQRLDAAVLHLRMFASADHIRRELGGRRLLVQDTPNFDRYGCEVLMVRYHELKEYGDAGEQKPEDDGQVPEVR